MSRVVREIDYAIFTSREQAREVLVDDLGPAMHAELLKRGGKNEPHPLGTLFRGRDWGVVVVAGGS